jgi:hypothetical protein
MIIALGIGLTAVSGQFNLSSVRHEEHQAYYTALSSTETIAAWITENADGDDPEEAKVIEMLFDRIPSDDAGITIDEAGIPEEAGTCTVNLRWLDADQSQLKITSTATFAGVTETVSLTLTRPGFTPSAFEGELKASSFSTDVYDERARRLNEDYKSGGVVALWEPNATNSNYNGYFNGPNGDSISGKSNKAILDDYIDENSTLEARWTNWNLTTTTTSSTDHNNHYILGTERLPINAADYGYTSDWRRFMVPENGRITIDPLEDDSVIATTDNKINPEGSANTRIVGLAIHGTDGKNVQFRLASGSAALGTPANNVFVSTGTVKDNGAAITNNIKTGATFTNRTTSRWASLITLDFTDNDGSDETAHYTINGEARSYPWHPNNWESMDLFVQSSGKLDTTNLILGPFLHKYEQNFDFEGKGQFIDSYNGVTAKNGQPAKNVASEWPYVNPSGTGLPVFSVDFGKNAGFWILDGSDKYFRIMQGVNILGGTSPEERSIIYSTRKTIIGGALIRGKPTSTTSKTDSYTTDNLNGFLDGFADQSVTTKINYVEATTRFSQLIYNTDIILMAPSSGTAESKIRRPDTWQDRRNMPGNTTAAYKTDTKYNPTMTIAGGTIYVGKGQHLTIEGSKSRSGDFQNGDNMWISPDKIVVADGGKLTIESSDFTNILTDIYVEGGTLTINAGAKITGNISAYNDGTVKVGGAFRLDSPSTLEPERAHDGLLIYGADTIGAKIKTGEGANDFVEITKAAKLETPATLTAITGTSSRVHLVGGDWATLVPKTPVTALSGTYAKDFLCDGYDTNPGRIGRCPHYAGNNSGSGGWIVGTYDDS